MVIDFPIPFMKTSVALLFVVLIGLAAFLMGRRKPGEAAGQAATARSSPAEVRAAHQGPAIPDARIKLKARAGAGVLTPEKAALLTSEERIALLKKAAILADPEKQADILCGLISVMTQDELTEATKTLLDAQRRGNKWSTETWNTLWTRWGQVNAEACLALSKTGEHYPGWYGLNGLNTTDDYRCLMAGWLEVHPEEAMAWARQAKDDRKEAAAAAFAITSGANGDLKQMESAILSINGDKLTTQACFRDYFDLASSTGDKPLPPAVYDQLDPTLRPAAWPEVLERLAYSDSETAASWLKQHANDPGHDDRAIYNLVGQLAGKDPAGTAKWAIELPIATSNDSGGLPHPAVRAVGRWLQQDPEAANAWLLTQPADAPWVAPFKPGK
jgi:hypothetical protein